jgi:hypothetical protein
MNRGLDAVKGSFSSKPDAWRICCYTDSASEVACWAIRSFLTDSQSRSAGSITSRPAIQNSLEEHGPCFSRNVPIHLLCPEPLQRYGKPLLNGRHRGDVRVKGKSKFYTPNL